jgi:ribosomal protein L6P/L9E
MEIRGELIGQGTSAAFAITVIRNTEKNGETSRLPKLQERRQGLLHRGFYIQVRKMQEGVQEGWKNQN